MLLLHASLDEIVALSEIPVEYAAKLFETVYQTNVFAAVAVTNAFLPLLRKAQAACIVSVSSVLSSLRQGQTHIFLHAILELKDSTEFFDQS